MLKFVSIPLKSETHERPKKEKQLHQAFFLLDSSAARKSWLNFEAPPPLSPLQLKLFKEKTPTTITKQTKIEHHDTQTKINSLTLKCELMYKFSSLLNI